MLFMRTIGACFWIIPYTFYLNEAKKRENFNERRPHTHILFQRNTSCLKFSIYIFFILLVQGLAFFMIKYLPLAEVTIFLNMGPILTVFVSSCFLVKTGMKAKCTDTLKLVIGCIGVIMVIVGKKILIQDYD